MNYTTAPRLRGRRRTTHYGRITEFSGNRLITKSLVSGIRHYTPAADIKVRRGCHACRLEDLKPGDRVRVTVKAEDDNLAIAITCLTGE